MSEPFNIWQARFAKLRSNTFFEAVVIAIIVISALVLGAKTYDETTQIEQKKMRYSIWIMTKAMSLRCKGCATMYVICALNSIVWRRHSPSLIRHQAQHKAPNPK